MAITLMPDWGGMLSPDVPLAETFLRGTVIYLALFLLLRVVLKRQAGNVSITDMLLIVLIADASQNAMANDYKSLPNGLLLVGTLVFWDYMLDWLSYRFPRLRALVHPDPLPLIHNGRVLKENLKRELITEEQLESKLRQQGVEDPRQVRKACLEGDGHVSVIKAEEKEKSDGPPQGPRGGPAEGDADPAETPEGPGAPAAWEPELSRFLRSADTLRRRIEWHRREVADHEVAITAIKEVLTRHGFRAGPLTGTRKKRWEGTAPPAGTDGSKPEG